jgi:hypothetical protein
MDGLIENETTFSYLATIITIQMGSSSLLPVKLYEFRDSMYLNTPTWLWPLADKSGLSRNRAEAAGLPPATLKH